MSYAKHIEKQEKLNKVVGSVLELEELHIIPSSIKDAVNVALTTKNNIIEPVFLDMRQQIPFEDGKCMAKNWHTEGIIADNIALIQKYRSDYVEVQANKFEEDTSEKELELEALVQEIDLANENNIVANSIELFQEWQAADIKVTKLKSEYAKKLSQINTGVEGLTISLDELGDKMAVHLMYDGAYNPDYFSNPKQEVRKLSSYSGTQKPMICLLIQNYLLNKKPKALRYLWIDNVPIDKKTKELLNVMGEKLDLTIFINITGDFDKSKLDVGDILLEGGEVFFNKNED